MKKLIVLIVLSLFVGGYATALYAESKEKRAEISFEKEVRTMEMDDANKEIPPYAKLPYQMPLSTIPKFLRSKGTKYYILQFKGRNVDKNLEVYDKFCKESKELIDEIYAFVSDNELFVKLRKQNSIEELRGISFIESVRPYHPIFKLHLPFADKILNQQEINLSRHVFYVCLFGGEKLGDIVKKIKETGFQVSINERDILGATKTGDVLEVAKSHPNWQDFVNLANIDCIFQIELVPVYELSD